MDSREMDYLSEHYWEGASWYYLGNSFYLRWPFS